MGNHGSRSVEYLFAQAGGILTHVGDFALKFPGPFSPCPSQYRSGPSRSTRPGR